MLDRLTSMAVFVKAADLGSFTAAATALGLTSQMVGKHVAVLEARLGAVLLQRTTRRMRLTDTGQRYYERCRAVLAEAAAADALMEDVDAQPHGRLRVSAPVGFGACQLAPVISELLDRHPGLEIELVLTDRFVDVIDESYDAVLRLGPLGETSLVVHPLADHDQIACAAPAYLARHGVPQAPADLADHSCLGFVNWSGLPFAEWRFGQEGIVHAAQIHSRFQVNDGRVLVAAAVAGHGIILQPEAVVAGALADGRLVPILTNYAAPSRPLCLLHPAREPRPAKLRVFVDHVVAAFPPRRARSASDQPGDRL